MNEGRGKEGTMERMKERRKEKEGTMERMNEGRGKEGTME